MKNWRNSEPYLNRNGGCRHCSTPSRLHKIQEVISKSAKKLKDFWKRRKKSH
ncbi:hypothetical protein HYV11_03065 [Candidatus Dependentiae bacterium]|nr:hypothetical protein [Candidatus Dependentiae bacterium]